MRMPLYICEIGHCIVPISCQHVKSIDSTVFVFESSDENNGLPIRHVNNRLLCFPGDPCVLHMDVRAAFTPKVTRAFDLYSGKNSAGYF